MRRTLFFLPVIFLLSGFLAISRKEAAVTRNISYGVGEELEYRVHFGIFTVGKGITRVDKVYHSVNDRTCFKVDAYGETSNWISWVAKVNDNWGAYIDTTTMLTHQSYRKLREGKYTRDEQVTFDHTNKKVEVKVKNKDTGAKES